MLAAKIKNAKSWAQAMAGLKVSITHSMQLIQGIATIFDVKDLWQPGMRTVCLLSNRTAVLAKNQ